MQYWFRNFQLKILIWQFIASLGINVNNFFVVAGVVAGSRRQSATLPQKSDYVKRLQRGNIVELKAENEAGKVLDTVVGTDWFNMLVTLESAKEVSAEVLILPGTAS